MNALGERFADLSVNKLMVLTVAVIAAFLLLIGWVILVPLGGRHDAVIREHRERDCHSLGHDYHWWDDHDRCVKYVSVAAGVSG